MAYTRTAVPPLDPISRAEAVALYPSIRQSLLSGFDECSLRALWEMRIGGPWSSKPQALGVIFHRIAAEILTALRDYNQKKIPQQEALEIMYDVCRQRGIPPEQRVKLPLRERVALRQMVIYFVSENTFSIDRLVGIERNLEGVVSYDTDDGIIPRKITGQLDALLWDPPDPRRNLPPGAIVLDWKTDRALPPEPRDPDESHPDPLRRLSFEGYFQQRYYGLLVFQNFPAVERVTLREFYVRHSVVRQATLFRSKIEHIEREIAGLVEEFDTAVMSGTRDAGTGSEKDGWLPSPGRGCRFCPKPASCPIEREARGEGAIENEIQARKYAAEYAVADKVREHRREALKVWASGDNPEVRGEKNPEGRLIPVKGGKGRYVMGFQRTKSGNGSRFGVFVPDDSDRGPEDPKLEDAFAASAAEAKKARRDEKKGRAA